MIHRNIVVFACGFLLAGAAFADSGKGQGAARRLPQSIGDIHQYVEWGDCQEVDHILNQANADAWGLLLKKNFVGSVQRSTRALNEILRIFGSGSRGYMRFLATTVEANRSLALLGVLDRQFGALDTNQPQSHGNQVKARFLVNRLVFLRQVYREMDTPQIISSSSACRNRSCQVESFSLERYVQIQLESLKSIAVIFTGGQFYPLSSIDLYLDLYQQVTTHVAQDLSSGLYRTRYSCALSDLYNALDYAQRSVGNDLDTDVIQEHQYRIEDLVRRLRGFNCGGI